MNNSWRTQFQKVENLDGHLRAGGKLMPGQYKKLSDQKALSRCLYVTGEKTGTFLHGDNVNPRFNKCHKARTQGVVIPSEPPQFKMMVGGIPSDKLEAMVGIGQYELNSRMGV